MAVPSRPAHVVRFEGLEVDLRAGELRRNGQSIKLQEQPLQILAMLLERPGETVTREEIQKKLWPTDTFVEFDHSINAAIQRLRQALGDSAEHPRFVETMARRGYRFIAPVEALTPGPSPGGKGEAEWISISRPSPAGERVSRLVGAGEGTPLRRHRTIAATGGTVVTIVAVLIALNVAGLRERIVGPGLAPARPAQGPALPKIESLAVLPLENLSGDPEQEYFSDGMTDALITDLGQVSALRVISRQSMMRYRVEENAAGDRARAEGGRRGGRGGAARW